jgi:DNA-binding MurR/RpiR family transcriptional regulator
MFDYQRLKDLTELEREIFVYCMDNKERVVTMQIRELASLVHVSSSSIMRMCKSLGLSGFSEFRYQFSRMEKERVKSPHATEYFVGTREFLNYMESVAFKEKLLPIVEEIQKSDYLLFVGVGNSGALAKYGATYFANKGANAFYMSNPYHMVASRGLDRAFVIALSVSGETEMMVRIVENIREADAKTLAVTSDNASTLAQLSNYRLEYFIEETSEEQIEKSKMTSQVSVLALIEYLAHLAFDEYV